MLGCFVSAYTDELFASTCGRFLAKMYVAPSVKLGVELFAQSTCSCPIDFPAHLNHVVGQLPPGHPLTVDQIIDGHTLYPFTAPFLQPARAARLREQMKTGAGRSRDRRLLTGRRSSVSVPEYLRYCPGCIIDDRMRQRECYWHRVHQVPGVEVCPIHEVWLETSTVSAWDPRGDQRMLPAEQVVTATTPRPLSMQEPGRESILALARNAAWLLAYPQSSVNLQMWADRYRYLLAERGWSTYRKRLTWAPFWTAFLRIHPMPVLRRLDGHAGSLCTGRGIRALLRFPRRAMPPLYHLLLIHFLGFTAEEFFALPQHPTWFGTGPWPCLNPVVPHRNERAVVQCEVRIRRQDGRPIGTFSCGCGFTYSRVGPDWGPLAQFSYHRIEQYGLYWEWVLQRRWRDRRLMREGLAEQLGVSRVTLWEEAIRLGLLPKTSSPREGKRWNGDSAVHLKDCEQNRLQWQQLAQRRRRTLAQERRGRRLYAWLFRWDGVWLRAHQRRNRETGWTRDWAPRLDWATRDRQAAQAIIRAAGQLTMNQEPPQWISRHRLMTHSGYARWIAASLDRLPQTRQAIQSAVETRQAFQLRRAIWREGEGRGTAVLATESQVRRHPVTSACGQSGLFEAEGEGW